MSGSYGSQRSKCLGPSRNSLCWGILRVSRLLRGFYSEHHGLTLISRGFYVQNMGGGILRSYAPVCLSFGTPEAAPLQNRYSKTRNGESRNHASSRRDQQGAATFNEANQGTGSLVLL